METIVALVLGIIVGGAIGALAMLAVRGKRGEGQAELRSKLEIVSKSLDESKRVSDEYKQDAAAQRAKVEEGNVEIAKLQTEFKASQSRFEELEQSNEDLTRQVVGLREQATDAATKNANLTASLEAANNRLAEQTDIEKTLKAQFEVMANEAITHNNDVFLKNADEKIGALLTQAKTDFSHNKDAVQELVKPLSDELKRIEKDRSESQGSLKQQLETLVQNNNALTEATGNLTNALKRPEVRGSWGEIQLERVAELAGLVKDLDYRLQVSVPTEDGGSERPDMIVDMPNGRNIVVDAKAPMRAYLDAVDTSDESEREELIQRHAQQVRERARGLAQKSYQQKFNSPDFVVMFLPGEVFLQPALEKDPELLDWAMQQKVVIATPNTLLALLKTVAMGWREVQLAEEARRIGKLGQELHDRLETFAGHMVATRNSLNRTVESFNKGVGSLERNVLTSARRFKDMGISSTKNIPELDEITTPTREFGAATLRSLPEPDVVGDD